jgi:CelD/BcsL family acetyltransferase involved in cellulose biosynthesis
MQALLRLAPWEICEFTELAPNAAALKLDAPASLKMTLSDASSAPVLKLPDRVDELERVVPRLRLRQLKHARKAAAKRGEVAIVIGDEDNSEGLLNDLIRLHAARWNGRGDGVFADKRVAEFHAAALPGLIAANLARLYGLMIGDAVAAVYYGFADRGKAYAYLQGFDPKFERESPGLIVVGYAIEQAVKEGAHEFHFLRGDEPYKYEWGASARRNRLKQFVRDSAIVPG